MPAHLKKIVLSSVESSHFYRNQWYFGGEATLRAKGTKIKVQSIPSQEWNQVEMAASKFWDDVAETGEVAEK